MANERNKLTDSAIERKLAALKPKPSSVDRDRLMYLAGQRSVLSPLTRRGWLWPALTAVSATAALIMAMVLINGGVNRPTARDVVQQPEPSDSRGRGERVEEVRPPDEAIVREDDARGDGTRGDGTRGDGTRGDGTRGEMVSERGRTMFALRQAVSESGVGALTGGRSSRHWSSTPTVWDEVRTANLREPMVSRNLRGGGQSKGLLGIFSLGTES